MQGILLHVGPNFPTFTRHGAATTPDKILSNKHHYLNTMCEPGNITTSDHIPVIFKLSTTPFITLQPPVDKFHRGDWESFQQILNSKINITNLNYSNTQQIEN